MSVQPLDPEFTLTSRSLWPMVTGHPFRAIGSTDACWHLITVSSGRVYCGRRRDEHDPRPFDYLMRDNEAIVRHGLVNTERLMTRYDVKRAVPPRRWTFAPDGMRRDHELFVNDDWRPR